MIADKMKALVKNSSAIRAMFEEGKIMAAKYGAENVYDFSLGNPNVPAPVQVKEAIIEEAEREDPIVLHGYMSNAGYEDVRQAVAESINKKFDTAFSAKNIIMTVGAAGGLNVILKTLLNPGDEVIAIAPYLSLVIPLVSRCLFQARELVILLFRMRQRIQRMLFLPQVLRHVFQVMSMPRL